MGGDIAPPASVERHLHPLALHVALPRLGPQLFGLIPLLAAVSISGRWGMAVFAIAIFAGISLTFAFLRWRRFVWMVDEDAITIRQGLWSRSERVLPIERIQDVAIEQKLVHRLLGLAIVSFESGAGGEGKRDDARIDAISMADAQGLREQLRHNLLRDGQLRDSARGAVPIATGDAAAVDEPAPPGHILHHMGLRRLLVSGIFQFSLAIFGIAFGFVTQFDRFFSFDLWDFDFWQEIANQFGLGEWVGAYRWLAFLGTSAVVLLIGAIAGLVRTILRDWDFTLSSEPRGLRRTRGLTTRTDVLIPRARVQAAIISSGPVRRLFGYYALYIQNLARDDDGDGKQERDHLVAPCVRLTEVDGILADIGLSRSDLHHADWARPHGAMILRIPLVFMGIAALQTIVMAIVAPQLLWVPVLLVASALLAVLTGWLDWRLRRWRFDGRTLESITGWLRSRHVILPARHVQSADLYISPLRRRFGLADLLLGVPGGKAERHRLSYIRAPQLHALRISLLQGG